MRKFIIDTDIGSDDAVAVIMALKQKDIEVLGITTVAGNCDINNVVNNALMTIEVTNKQKLPVYKGCSCPIIRKKYDAVNVHGNDGMGDCDLIHPTTKAEEKHAVMAMLDLIKTYPNEIEIIALGPVTNIALAIMMDRETMGKVKHIWSMSTGGFGLGNVTPYAEFNVFADPESFDIMLKSQIPLTIIGFDLCIQDGSPLTKEDMDFLLQSNVPEAVFSVKCNKELLNYNLRTNGHHIVDLPDAVAMAVAIWNDIVLDAPKCYCETSLIEKAFYGQVAVYPDDRKEFLTEHDSYPKNATVIRKIDTKKYKDKLLKVLSE